ncbi:hypothetical protein HYR99_38370 [Candidatus Poribacteria bacterium]|nr:hypothetical protein [Candidatus Poribacteria bacterium]
MKRLFAFTFLLLFAMVLPLAAKGGGASVKHETEGTLSFGPMPLTIELPAISDEPIEITAKLEGNWRGKGTLVVTPSGVENHHIQIETFEGTLEVSHELDGLPSPIVIGLKAERGSVNEHKRSSESLLDLFVKAKSIVLVDPSTGEEIPWLTDLLGPMPNMIKIKDGELQFIKTTGRAHLAPPITPSIHQRISTWAEMKDKE